MLISSSLLISFIIFIVSFLVSIFLILYKQKLQDIQTIIPLAFVTFFGLHVIPFGINCTFNQALSQRVYFNIDFFRDSIPLSFILCAIFLLCFTAIYKYLPLTFLKVKKEAKPYQLSKSNIWILLGLFGISLLLIQILGSGIGGIYGVILKGYHVTELFIGKGHLANAFDWICGIGLLFWINSLSSKKVSYAISMWLVVFLLVFFIFAVMGRRSIITSVFLTMMFSYHCLYKNIGFFKAIFLLGTLFCMLTAVGLLRGPEYSSFSDVFHTLTEKSKTIFVGGKHTNDTVLGQENIQEELSNVSSSILYVFTTGQFAQPYQCFPHVIQEKDKGYALGYGKYTFLQPISLIVPSAVWKNRPLTYAQWYATKYRGTQKLTEGVQFFGLAVGYMDFGAIGMLLYGLLYGVFFKLLSCLFVKFNKNVIVTAIIFIICGNIILFVVGDMISTIIVLAKSMLFPVIVIGVYQLLGTLVRKKN